jgi:hypothetical protein
VERTFAWLNQFRRLRVRHEKRADIHAAFLSLGCALICWQSLRRMWRTAYRGLQELVTFMQYDLGYFDDQTCRFEPIENPFGPKLLPIRSE